MSFRNSMPREHHRRRFGLMTAYQFAFYTFYQFFEAVSLDRWSAFKAGVVIACLEIMALFAILIEINLLRHTRYLPPMAFVVAICVVLGLLIHYAFDYHERWKEYAREFKRHSRTELITGRLLVAAMVVLVVGGLLVSLRYYQQVNGIG